MWPAAVPAAFRRENLELDTLPSNTLSPFGMVEIEPA